MDKKILEDHWNELCLHALDGDMPPEVIALFKRVYYAGALVVFNGIVGLPKDKSSTIKERGISVRNLRKEISDFWSKHELKCQG
jgi:hypothetical protein